MQPYDVKVSFRTDNQRQTRWITKAVYTYSDEHALAKAKEMFANLTYTYNTYKVLCVRQSQ